MILQEFRLTSQSLFAPLGRILVSVNFTPGEILKRCYAALFARTFFFVGAAILLSINSMVAAAVDTKFHNAPDSAKATKNPYEGDDAAAQAGKALYARNCLSCHGKAGKGTGNVPSLVDGKLDSDPAR